MVPPVVEQAQPTFVSVSSLSPAVPASQSALGEQARSTNGGEPTPYTDDYFSAMQSKNSADSSNLKTIVGLVAAAAVILVGSVIFVQNAQNSNKGAFNRGLYSTAIEKARENFEDGKYSQSVSDSTDAIAEARKLGPSDPELGKALDVRARAYFADRKFDKSEQDFTQALAQTQAIYGDKALQSADIKAELGNLMLVTGRYAQAESLLQQTLGVQQALKAKEAEIADTNLKLASAHMHLNRVQLATDDSKRALALEEKALPANDPKLEATRQLVQSLSSSKNADFDSSQKGVPTIATENRVPQEKVNKPAPAAEHVIRKNIVAAHQPSVIKHRHAYSTYGY